MNKLLNFLLFAMLFGLSGCGNATEDPKKTVTPTTETQAVQLSNLINIWSDKIDVPSVLLRVQRGNNTLFHDADGLWSLDYNEQRAVGKDEYFRSASVAKLFTAVTVLRLIEQSKLTLDSPIHHYLEDELVYQLFGYNSESVTVEHLLSHTSGLANIDNDEAKNSWMMETPEKVKQPEKLLAFAAELGLQYEPGQGQQYTSAGYILLGLIIESVTEQPYHQVVRQLVLDPLELKHTFEHTNEWPTGVELIHSYAGSYDMNQIHPSMEFADGGFVTTTADLTRFGLALATGELLMNSQSYNSMMTSYGAEGIGLGPFIDTNSSGNTIFYHPGHWGVLLYVDPGQQLAIAFTVNQSEVEYANFLDQILKIVNQ